MYRMALRRVLTTLWSKSAHCLGLGFLALFVQAASAQAPPLNYFQNYFVTGDYVVGGVAPDGQGPNPTNATINFSGVPCTSGPGLSLASCHAAPREHFRPTSSLHFCTGRRPSPLLRRRQPRQPAPSTLTSAIPTPLTTIQTYNVPMVGTPLGSPQVPACVVGGGTENPNILRARLPRGCSPDICLSIQPRMFEQPITRTRSAFSGNPTGTVFNGATLVVVYRLVTPGTPRIAPLRSVVIYDGAFTGVASRSPSLNHTMGGWYQSSTSTPSAKMTQIVGGATSKFTETLTVNGSIPQGVPSNPFVGAQGPLLGQLHIQL